ncbi:MAG: hypothetical protein K1X74_08490 [Pirellulales bacterium]|nr:hypothetical protein [Pirellulales bacterium]
MSRVCDMNDKQQVPGQRFLAVLLVAQALSIGWGVRGNWGHEYGAMIPGALAAMAAVLVSARDDWQRRIAYFACFGALGWSFGGQISYMMVIGYTHSGDFPSTLYGFAGLFLIGFIWGAMGGAGTALPAGFSRERMTELFVPIGCVFAAWCVEDLLLLLGSGPYATTVDSSSVWGQFLERFHYDRALDWYDTDWFSAVLALVAICLFALIQRGAWRSREFLAATVVGVIVGHLLFSLLGCELPRPYRLPHAELYNWGGLVGGTLAATYSLLMLRKFDRASELVVFMGLGWLLGLLLLVEIGGLRMTPPRGDSWAGALGMTVGMFVYLLRQGQLLVAWGGLFGGLFGGLGFAGGSLIKLLGMTSGYHTNWHSVLEQSFGFISGIGIALLTAWLSTTAPRAEDEPPTRRWTELAAVLFTILVIPYVNIRKNLWTAWLNDADSNPATPTYLPEEIYGISTYTWFHLAYLALGLAVVVPLLAHYRGRRVALMQTSWLGRGQLLFVVFLWWIVIGNLTRLVPFNPQRMVTEGVIHVHACICTLLALVLPVAGQTVARRAAPDWGRLAMRTAWLTLLAAALMTLFASIVVRSIYFDHHAGESKLLIRFGPHNTNAKEWSPEELAEDAARAKPTAQPSGKR